jgi:hypothetical protein
MRTMSLTSTSALAAILLGVQAHAVIVLQNGESVNVGSLMASGSDRTIIIDDKIFHFESLTSTVFHRDDFTITAFVSASVNQWGLRNVGFDLIGPFGDGTPGDGIGHEMNLQYSVAVRPEWYDRDVRLCDTHLTFNGSAGLGGSYARVDETVWDFDTNTFLGNLSVYDHSGLFQKYQDDKNWCEIYGVHGYRAFEVNKDMKFFARTPQDFATASFVRQEFSQILAPTPGAFALLLASGACTVRRRR